MDDFLNFFKTSLFWSPIRGCSLKQRLKVNKHSCSNTVNAVLKQKKRRRRRNSPTKMLSKRHITARSRWFRGRSGARPLRILTSHSCRGRSSSRCCSSHAGCRMCATMCDRAPTGRESFCGPWKTHHHVNWKWEMIFLHRGQTQSHWSDSHNDRHTGAWGPVVK